MKEYDGPLGILVPMQEEVELLIAEIEHGKMECIAERVFYVGTLAGKEVVLGQSGIGKVASSFTAALLIHHFGAKTVVVAGVAGGLADHIQVGDLVVASFAIQHDMDCRPLFPKFEIPTKQITRFKMDEQLTQMLLLASEEFLEKDFEQKVGVDVLRKLGIHKPSLFMGLLASGDQFIGTIEQWKKIREELPDALFVEMEGAAVAQVCHDSGIPMCSIRTISDKANAVAHVDFGLFLTEAAKRYTSGVIKRFASHLVLYK